MFLKEAVAELDDSNNHVLEGGLMAELDDSNNHVLEGGCGGS